MVRESGRGFTEELRVLRETGCEKPKSKSELGVWVESNTSCQRFLKVGI
jgi:hypothetical protein